MCFKGFGFKLKIMSFLKLHALPKLLELISKETEFRSDTCNLFIFSQSCGYCFAARLFLRPTVKVPERNETSITNILRIAVTLTKTTMMPPEYCDCLKL